MADSQYEVGAHPDTGVPVVKFDHGHYGLGCLPKTLSAFADSYPPVSAVYPDVPAKDWTEQDLRPFCPPVMNQGTTSSCAPHSLAEAMMTAFRKESDLAPALSPWFGYGVLNQGRDVGTALPDLLRLGQEVGLAPSNLVRAGDFSGRYDQSVYTAAKNWKIEAAFNAPTFANLCSSIERRDPSVIGIDIGSNFNPDAEGYLPPYRQGPQILGHALTVVGKKLAKGQWWLLVMNHWSVEFGIGGFAWMPPSYINAYYGAWTCRTVALNPYFRPPALAA